MKRILAVLVVAGVTACGGPGSIEGKIDGKTFEVNDAIVASSEDTVMIALVNLTDACSSLKSKTEPKNLSGLMIMLAGFDSAGKPRPVVAGEYEVVDFDKITTHPPRVAAAFALKTDGQCKDTIEDDRAEAVSGTVKLTSIDLKAGGSAEGTFEFVFGPQKDKVSGSFGASYCKVPESSEGDSGKVCG